MISFFFIIAIASGFFGVLLLLAPKLYSSVAKSLTKTVTTIDDVSFRYKILIGILLIIVSISMFYVIYLHKQLG